MGRGPQPRNPFGGRGLRPGNEFAGGASQSPALGNSPRPNREPEPDVPTGADPIARSLIEVKSADMGTKKRAIQRLERTAPDEQAANVVAALLPILDDDDGFLVSDTIKALAVWHTPEVVPALIVRPRTTASLSGTKRSRRWARSRTFAVEPLIDRFSEDGFQVEAALKQIGTRRRARPDRAS